LSNSLQTTLYTHRLIVLAWHHRVTRSATMRQLWERWFTPPMEFWC